MQLDRHRGQLKKCPSKKLFKICVKAKTNGTILMSTIYQYWSMCQTSLMFQWQFQVSDKYVVNLKMFIASVV